MMSSIDAYYEDRPRRRIGQLYQPIVTDSIFQIKLRKALLSHRNKRFAAHFEKLDLLLTDRTLLDGCSEPPSSFALGRARAVLHQFETEDLEPTRVVASVEGGVGICFVQGDKYADIECFNAGEILGVVSNRRDRPNIWKVEPSAVGFAEASARIRNFLGGTSRTHDEQREAR
jgi:hypothetical protein